MEKKIAFVVTVAYVFLNYMSVSTSVIGVFDNFALAKKSMDKLYRKKVNMYVDIVSEGEGIWGWTITTKRCLISAKIQSIYADIH